MPQQNLSPALEGLRWKLRRAVDHFTDVDVAVGEVLDSSQPDAFGPTEVQPDGQLIFKVGKQRPLDFRITLIVGDCIHNTRSVLDHLVAQLAILNNCVSAITKTAFPVCLSQADFRGISKGKVVPFVSPAALAEIEKFQPYSTGNGADDLLWMLHQLDIIDKHRVYIIAKNKMRTTGFRVKAENGQEISQSLPNTGPWHSTEDGAELLRFQVSKNFPAPVKMYVEIHTTVAIQIEQTGLFCDGVNLLILLHDFIEYVTRIVDHFGKMFFGE